MTAAATGRVLARSDEIQRIIARLAHQILEPNDAQQGLVLLGVRRGGEALATRLAREIEGISGRAPVLGFLNINLYRDDRVTHELPESQIPAPETIYDFSVIRTVNAELKASGWKPTP